MSFRIAFIGAGSIEFTRKLVADLLTVPEFDDVELSFTDIDRRNLGMIAELCRRDIAHNKRAARIVETTDRRAALAGARYVFCVVRVGGLEAFRTDIEIPLRYGVDQCVGDTLCAGGLMYAQRGIAAVLDFCRDIREVAEPGCLLLNYANPMAMLTWAANVYGGVRCVGLCHGVQHGAHQIAEVLGVRHDELSYVCAGINHQTWFVDVRAKGRRVDGTELLVAFERHPVFSRTEKCRIDVLRRFGFYSTESNGHLSEYLMWYRKRPAEIGRWCDLETWILGETGGYLRVCAEGRNWFEKEFKQGAEGHPPLTYATQSRSDEHGAFILEALETGRVYRGHFNLPNAGAIANLPADAVIEGPGYVDRHGIHMLSVGELPLGCAAVCNQSVSVQRMGVRAAVTGDVFLLKQAMLLDPLVGTVCNPPEVWRMTDELLVAQSRWLPQYRKDVVAARQRLRTEPAIKTAPSPGYRPSRAELARRSKARRTKDRGTR
jgi:alpha-galactosidase